ncbi:hypothetical protein [Halobellus limi]|uniref:Uncharacterized protein n=1 Tax=Halobellus limi TaxID=699433 RepID=A0A1H5SZX4_9EURY|nr:hypothetical protein [Halobellus limi]SEF56065.1 hypothetical protein SAMN04488133_0129 [Halobellus limi]
MADVTAVAAEWLAATGAPNAVVILALLTSPATWSKRAVAFVRQRIGADDR